MDAETISEVPGLVLRETIRVAKRVHNLPSTGNGMSVRLCKREDFPADCLPTITSYRRSEGATKAGVIRTWGRSKS
jgi:hypothetical protein